MFVPTPFPDGHNRQRFRGVMAGMVPMGSACACTGCDHACTRDRAEQQRIALDRVHGVVCRGPFAVADHGVRLTVPLTAVEYDTLRRATTPDDLPRDIAEDIFDAVIDAAMEFVNTHGDDEEDAS